MRTSEPEDKRAEAPFSSEDEAPSSMPLRLGKPFVKVASGRIVGRALSFLGNVLAGRVLGVAGFGMLGVVRSTISLGTTATDFGVGAAAARYAARWRDVRPDELSRLMGLAGVVATFGAGLAGFGLFTIAPRLAHDVYRTGGLEILFRAAAPWVVAAVVSNLTAQVLRGFERFGLIAALDVARGALSVTALALVLFLWERSALGAVLALGAVEVTVALAQFAMAWHELNRAGVRIGWPDRRTVSGPFRDFALPSYGFLLLQAPVSWLLLARLASIERGSEYVGAVHATGSFRNLLAIASAALSTTLLPILSRTHSLSTERAFQNQLRRLLRVLWFVAIPGGVMVAAALPTLMKLVFGTGYSELAVPCCLLVLVTTLAIVNEVHDRALEAVGRMWLSFTLGSGYAITAIVLTFVLVPSFELWGYAIAQIVAMAVYVFVQQEVIFPRRVHNARGLQHVVPWTMTLVGGTAAMTVALLTDSGLLSLPLAVLLALGLVIGSWRWILTHPERAYFREKAGNFVEKCRQRLTGLSEKEPLG